MTQLFEMRTPGGQKTALWGSKKCIIVYAGQYYDSETGLHYNYHRYYDPQLGRYLRADPIRLAGGVNLFAYVQNNPINRIDPLGLMSESDCTWLKSFIEGQNSITDKYKDIASGSFDNSYQQFVDLRRSTETIADASGGRSDAYNSMPSEVQHIVDVHESYHQWHMPFLVPSILYMVNLNAWAEFMAAEEYRAHSISNRLLNDLYKKECEKPCK